MRLDFGEDRRRLAVTGELAAQATLQEDRQLALLAEVRFPQLGSGDAPEALPEAVLAGPGVEHVQVRVEMARQELDHRLTDPGRAVDAVRDREDPSVGDGLPGRVGRRRVELADGVGAGREAQAEGRHVELASVAVRPQSEIEHALHGHATGVEHRARHAPDEVGVEALVARRHRGVDGERGVALDPVERVAECEPVPDELAGPLGQQECRVPLVQVPDGRRHAERPQRTHATDAEDQLLVEPHLPAADVQDVRDGPVLDGVLAHVRVEQQHRDAADLRQPDRDRQLATGQLQLHVERQAVRALDAGQRQPAEVVVGVRVFLMAVGVDRLAEVALAVQQADADERQRHVACRLHVIPGEDAQAAGVDAEGLMDPVLGAEVGDGALELVAVAALEPVTRAVGHVAVEVDQHILVFGEEFLVVEKARPVGRAADDRDGVAIAVPRRPVDEAPEIARLGAPRPVEVVRQPSEALESRWERERGGRDRRDRDGVHGGASYRVISCS